MPVYKKILSLLFIPIIYISLNIPCATQSFAAEEINYRYITNRINSFNEFESEGRINFIQQQNFLENSQEDLTAWQQKFQQLSISEKYSQTSPVQRKRVKLQLDNLGRDIQRLANDLKQAKENCKSRLEILNSYMKAWSPAPKDVPDEIKSMHSQGIIKLRELKNNSQKQLLKIDYSLKLVTRLQERLNALEQGEKNNLFQLWFSWVTDSSDPIFTPVYWNQILPGKSWLNIKISELEIEIELFSRRMISFSLLVLGIFITCIFLIRVMDKSDYFQNRSRIERIKSLRLLSASCFFFAVYASLKWIYPESMDAAAIPAFGAFYWAVLKLSKLICRQKNKLISGEARASLLFVISALLLAQQVPARTTSFLFLLILLLLWSYAVIDAWKKDRLHGVSLVAKRNSLFSPFFLIAMFGYGRLACVLFILWSLTLFIRGFGTAWAQILFIRTEMSVELKKGLVRSLAVPAGWAIGFGIAAFWMMDFFGYSAVSGIMDIHFTHGEYSISFGSIIWLAIFFFMTRQCVSAFKVSIEYVGSNWPKAKKGAVPSIQTLFSYAVWFLFSLITLNILGLSLTSITVIAGGLSVGIGFGLQNIVNNFIGGLILLFGRSIQQGDVIELNNLWCTVKKINIRTTQVETFENAVIIIPNADLIASQVTNWTKNNAIIRRDILVGVAYGSDIIKVRDILFKIAEEHPHVLNYPKPYVHFNNFGSSSLDFILRVWIDDIDVTLVTLSEIRFSINEIFRAEAIEIAFPQLDLHLKNAIDERIASDS
ncbi:mechanosensitive ion channel domain-containing protein [Maridesulfovibrio sp.]|uniref:mechanosensitive ion channel family protein n=1 Tax=Maridesulfovibrio sp. TaxID=2795000 RepID=UPI0029CA8E1C|nr:mechanosensitive ion channel domain-containing protein [Maridesulfovibrio sp.]